MKKIIIASERASDTEIISEVFNFHSVGSVLCKAGEIPDIAESIHPDAVFTMGFIESVSSLCFRKGMIYISLADHSPSPELFTPAVFNPGNRVFIPDRGLADFFNGIGVKNIFYKKAGFLTGEKRIYGSMWQRICLLLENDEIKYIQGMVRAQEVFPEQGILFKGLGQDLIEKIYRNSLFPCTEDPVYKRYMVTEGILKSAAVYYGRDRGNDPQKDAIAYAETARRDIEDIIKICGDF